ncbi:MAG: site-specific DNA-methyltransferase [Bacteroidetes bacterium]|nr:MAG: site-specific DNA-methyltransferase [Bacteroidota bacterium]
MSLKKIIQILGEPYFSNEFVAIYHLDCKEGLQKMLANKIKIDSTITSPPYNIGKEYEKALSVPEYIDWLAEISDLIYQVTKNNGSYLLNLGYLKLESQARALPIPYLIWDKIKFYLNQEIVWNYGAGVACKNYLSPRNEKILWYVKNIEEYIFNLDAIRDPDVKYPNSKKNGKLRANTLGKNPSDVWQIAKVTTGANRSSQERTNHPAQFPEDLVLRMILGFTNENDLILEPFLGSGTTTVVAMKNNRQCIGFELNKHYCEIAKQRIEQVECLLQSKKVTLF